MLGYVPNHRFQLGSGCRNTCGGLVNFPQGCHKGDEGIYHCVDFTFTGYRS
ncbi:hypothetical protein [Vibrio parahaemolyticus]|uniref:hypothetical protein n=1 Tax=Vibrio parahaemolyticus TaxID=670 RepID=UPI00235FB5C1|nr:hypothetical protein [Vibrio parahaemolyticus]